jgi:two-component system KDP operon response regulator KdpE
VRGVSGDTRIVLGTAVVDLERRTARRGDDEVRLTPIEYRLLGALAKHAGLVATHRQLLADVWGPTHETDTHYLRIYMKQLRDKLEAEPERPRYFLTEPGVGYRLRVDE